MTTPKRIYCTQPEYPAKPLPGDEEFFPISFPEDPDYFRVDRVAGVWLSLGLAVTVDETPDGYRLTINYPEAVPIPET
jgi:hypothetical protein